MKQQTRRARAERRFGGTLGLVAWIVLVWVWSGCAPTLTEERARRENIEDFLLEKLRQHRILVIPECLSHDSFDAVRLPLRLVRRWARDDHGIEQLLVGLETEVDSREFELVEGNSYYKHKRFATFCPPGWGLFSTKRLNEYLVYQDVRQARPGRFHVFGFENGFHYYDPDHDRYVLPSEVDTIEHVEVVPFAESEAPFVIKYTYSRFFRDYRSYSTIREMIESNPDACLIIIIGNAHTSREFYSPETDIDRQILEAYGIDREKYWHTVGYFLERDYDPVFVQSAIDSTVDRETLLSVALAGPDTIRFASLKPFYADYLYAVPLGPDTNLEEQPLVCVPSATNLELLESKNFQLYPDEEYMDAARALVYFMTGVRAKVKLDEPGKVAACTFVDPTDGRPLDFGRFADEIPRWYRDGTFAARLNEDVAAYNVRPLFAATLRSMGKADNSPLTESEARAFTEHLLALLSVIGTEAEQSVARKLLSKGYGGSQDYYGYYKKLYYGRYSAD